ncbi:hypothetical protein AB0G02_39860, partial [Actinosynnema sp. NPDC023658]
LDSRGNPTVEVDVENSLSPPARAALRALVALSDVWWGAEVLAAACGTPDPQGAAKLVRTGLVREDAGRYSVGGSVARHAGRGADLVPLVDRIAGWTATARPDAVAGELRVVERALRLALAAELHDTALTLARNASATLIRSRHLGAAMTVLGLGLRAAVGTGSARDELSFRYALAVCRLETGNTKQALEMAIAAASLSLDDTDEDLALRVRELHAEVQQVARRPPSTMDTILARVTEVGSSALATVTAGAKAVREACVSVVTSLPGGVQLLRLAQENPGIVRGVASIAVVAGLVLATVSASGNHDEVSAAPADPTTARALPSVPDDATDPRTTDDPRTTGGPRTTGDPAAPGRTGGTTTTSPPPLPGSTPTPGGTTPEDTTTGGHRPGGGGNDPEPEEPRRSIPATWGFARVWHVDRPIGTTHALSGPGVQDNDEANWTYGPWAMSSPPAGHPTATHTAVGRHRVRLPAVGTPGGSVQVTAQDYVGWTATG